MIFVIERSQGGGAHANLSEPKMNEGRRVKARAEAVSYTHLTLPTIYSV